MAHRTALTRLVVSCLLGASTFALAVSHFSAIIAGVGTWIAVAVT